MGKKIILGIGGGILAIGILICIVGFALGGRLGSFGVSGQRLVYETRNEQVDVGRAPGFMQNLDRFYFFQWLVDWDEILGNYDDSLGDSNHEPNRTNGSSGTGHNSLDLQVSADEHVEIDIDIGHVQIVIGSEAGISWDGPIEANTRTENGKLKISTKFHSSGITTRWIDGKTHYFKNGEDITTFYTITLPAELEQLEVELDMGTLELEGFTATRMEFDVAMASMEAYNLVAESIVLDSAMGNIEIAGLLVNYAEMDSQMGNIEVSGVIKEALVAKSEMGNIEVTMPQPDSYSWNCKAEMGVVTLDGNTIIKKSSGGTEGAQPYFDLTSEMGNIDVSFS